MMRIIMVVVTVVFIIIVKLMMIFDEEHSELYSRRLKFVTTIIDAKSIYTQRLS